MTNKNWIDLIGWIGSAEVIAAYIMISYFTIPSRLIYQLLNLSGAIFLIVNTFYYKAYPSTFTNLVWVTIALIALFRIQKKPKALRPDSGAEGSRD